MPLDILPTAVPTVETVHVTRVRIMRPRVTAPPIAVVLHQRRAVVPMASIMTATAIQIAMTLTVTSILHAAVPVVTTPVMQVKTSVTVPMTAAHPQQRRPPVTMVSITTATPIRTAMTATAMATRPAIVWQKGKLVPKTPSVAAAIVFQMESASS